MYVLRYYLMHTVYDTHFKSNICFLEGEIGKDMIQHKKTYLMPDRTSRSKVGKMGGCLVHIENKVRALKLQLMGKDTKENWADTIIHKLKRLSTASDKTVQEIYKAAEASSVTHSTQCEQMIG